MDSTTRNALTGLMVFLQGKAETFGINKRLTVTEGMLLGLKAWSHIDQRASQQHQHPDAMLFGPLLEADMGDAAQKVMETVQLLPDGQYVAICERFLDYSATLADPVMRKKAMMVFGVMASAKLQNEGGHMAMPRTAGASSSFAPGSFDPEPLRALPHPDTELFSYYMECPPATGSERISLHFATLSKVMAADYIRRFTDYAVSLRDSQMIKRAMALSNMMFWLYKQKDSSGVIALPSPQRR